VRRRILLLVVGMTTLVVLAFAVPVGVLLHSAVAQRAEHATIDQANSVGAYLRSGSRTQADITNYATQLSSSSGRPTSVRMPSGAIVGSPPPGGPLDLPQNGPPSSSDGRSGGGPDSGPGGSGPGTGPDSGAATAATLHPTPGGQVAELSVAGGDGNRYLVLVYVSNSALHAGEAAWWTLLIAGSIGLLLVGVVAAELLTRRIVRPLIRTAQTAHQLSVGDTGARAPVDGPREIAQVGSALNRLADRIDELIAEERETVADLSHRMRTPLTALRLDAEALRDPAESERVGSHVSALERTLTAVIHAARRPQREGRMPSCDATAVVGERVEFWSVLADDQNRTSTVRLPGAALPVRTSADDLAAAVDALLENVFAHTAEGVPFTVTLAPTPTGARLEVADEGEGLTADDLIRGRSDRGSSGLGLSIARRCAEASGGSMTLGSGASGGAVITLALGAP
jgi:signal transduction histidine kinase